MGTCEAYLLKITVDSKEMTELSWVELNKMTMVTQLTSIYMEWVILISSMTDESFCLPANRVTVAQMVLVSLCHKFWSCFPWRCLITMLSLSLNEDVLPDIAFSLVHVTHKNTIDQKQYHWLTEVTSPYKH